MWESSGNSRIVRHLPHVAAATALVLLLPSLGVYFLEEAGLLSSALASTLASIALSVALAQVMSAAWMRHSGSKDLVFGDLMLWGWLRRWRMERRFSDAMRLLGVDRQGRATREIFMSPHRQASIMTELAMALEAGDPFTHGHSKRVTRYANMIAKTMNLPQATVDKIRTAAAVHDVGKIDTPSEILNKPGSLSDEEFAVMKQHPVTGAAMVERLGNSEITAIVRHHHERMDGRGYPDALKGDEIPLGARVIAVADTFDAITSARPYRKGRSHAEAIEIIKNASGTQLDAEVVDAFLSYYSGKRSLALWMSLSTALQRIVGGFGNWVQHAQAGGLSGATASVGAAVVLTAAAAGALPGASAIRLIKHDDRSKRVVAQERADHDVPEDVSAVADEFVAEPEAPSDEQTSHPKGRVRHGRSERGKSHDAGKKVKHASKKGRGKEASDPFEGTTEHPNGSVNPAGKTRGKSFTDHPGHALGHAKSAKSGTPRERGPRPPKSKNRRSRSVPVTAHEGGSGGRSVDHRSAKAGQHKKPGKH